MKSILQSLFLFLVTLLPILANAYEQLADGVYRDGSTLYIGSSVTALGPLQVNPSEIYSFAAVPPICLDNSFTGYGATLHMPPSSYGAYFIADYWGNFANMNNNAVEPTGVAISTEEEDMIVGNVINLTATVLPSHASLDKVIWNSTNPQIASVNGGTVTALALGECDIVASCLDKQAMCHVTVLDPISVVLDQTSVTIEQTQQLALTATVFPEDVTGQSVIWTTTDTSIATVSDGVVTGVGVGECDIIASYINKQAVCHVNVIAPTIYITLDMHDAKLLPNHALTIMPTMSPITTTLKVTSSNPEVAAVRLVNGVVQVVGLTEGTTMIVVASVDGQAVPDACKVTVFTEIGDVNCDGYVDISDVSSLIDHLLGNDIGTFSSINADTDRDNEVGISDVTMLMDYLLGAVDLNPSVTETFTVSGVTFKMIAVERGTFNMGATVEQGSEAESNEMPAHKVTLSSYSIGETEVTQALWQAVMGNNPSYFQGDLSRPVECVSWNDCQKFITKLNELTGRQFRLPTEAEWEFAARGGNRSQGNKYAGSNDINEVSWYGYNSNYETKPVATKASNELGIYDMSGNVWEWVQDWYGSYSSDTQINPMGPSTGSYRIYRGGGWMSYTGDCRVSYREGYYPTSTDFTCGMRLAL